MKAPEEMPPWLSLPPEVRERVNARMTQRYGPEPERSVEFTSDLRDLSAMRLIKALGLKKAMRKGASYPGFGPDPKDWLAAQVRCQTKLHTLTSNPAFIERAHWLKATVTEELTRFLASQ